MACNIVFNPIQTNHDGLGNITSVTVGGIANDCPRISVTLEVNDLEITLQADVINGNWQIEFNVLDLEIICDMSFQVVAVCLDETGQNLCQETLVGNLPCVPNFGCPMFGVFIIEIEPNCNENGTRSVSISIGHNSPNPFILNLAYGDGQFENNVARPAGIVGYREEHDYLPGNYVAMITVDGCDQVISEEFVIEECPVIEPTCEIVFGEVGINPRECENGFREIDISIPYQLNGPNVNAVIDFGDGNEQNIVFVQGDRIQVISVEHNFGTGNAYQVEVRFAEGSLCDNFTVDIPFVEECPPICPSIGDIEIEFGDCDENNRREVHILFGYDSLQDCRIEIVVIDRVLNINETIFPFNLELGQNQHFSGTILVPTGAPLSAFIRVVCEELDCPDIPIEDLNRAPSCDVPCPEFGEPTIGFGECNNGLREVIISFPIHIEQPITLSVDFGDNSEPEEIETRVDNNNYPINHRYPIGSSQTITISFPGCEDAVIVIDEVENCIPVIPPIDGNDGGGGNNGGGGGNGCCLGLRWLMVISGALAVVMALLYLCPAIATPAFISWFTLILAAASLTAIISAGIWWWCCDDKPCKWGLLVGGEAIFVGGLVAIHFINCCPTLFWSGLVAIGTGMGMLIKWKRDCKIGGCYFKRELSVLFVGAVAPTIALLDLVLGLCINPWIEGVVVVVAAGLTASLLSCNFDE